MPDIIEGFAVETTDDLIFTVKGLIHPPGRVIAYLRYLPDPAGQRARQGRRYRRVYRFDEQEHALRTRNPAYLAEDPVFGLRLQSVPRARIRKIHEPRQYLAELRQRGATDGLEEDALALARLLSEAACVPGADLGISGSLMLGLHRADSDIDLIVYGEDTATSIHQTLHYLLEERSVPLRRPNREELTALHAQHRRDTLLPLDAFARLQARKVNELRFRGRETFIRFVKHANEVEEGYGDRRFAHLGAATIRALVVDDREAIFTPCRYVLEHVTLEEGQAVDDLREMVSFRGRFSDQLRAGEWTMAQGRLERVTSAEAPQYHRLVVGGQQGDYVRVWRNG